MRHLKPLPVGLDSIEEFIEPLLPGFGRGLLETLVDLHIAGVTRYTPRVIPGAGRVTWCNVFTQDVAEVLGAELPRNTLANDLLTWLQSEKGTAASWRAVSADEAQAHADQGGLAVVACRNPDGPGHIAPLCPSLGESGTWVSNVGKTNFLRGRLELGFGAAHPLHFFINVHAP